MMRSDSGHVNNVNNVPVNSVPETERVVRLSSFYESEFGCRPSYFVRVPGRVNIIGEHVDYCGYPVLPMALDQDILVAAGPAKEGELRLRNTNAKYPPYNVDVVADLKIVPGTDGKPFWYNYVLCGIKGAIECLGSDAVSGLQMCVDGNVPPASGLSSSSALVSAACLSYMHAMGAKFTKSDIASLCAKCERYIGTQGGGMDQAIAFLAEKHSAQYITWNPLKASPVTLPEDAAFVVAHSMVEANKAATSDFNRRVIECRLAAVLLATLSGLGPQNKPLTLSDVQKLTGRDLGGMVELVHKCLEQEVYTKDDVCKILSIRDEVLDRTYLTGNTRTLDDFKLKQRALHVYQEAIRVEEFKGACLQHANEMAVGNGVASENGNTHNSILHFLGKLMSESHESLKNLYECSHENLDLLVELSQKCGVAARLTGAGWGGCVVALCPKNKTDEYISYIKENFYRKHFNIVSEDAEKYIFATVPNRGAEIYVYSR